MYQASNQALSATVEDLRTQLVLVKGAQTALDVRCANLQQQLIEVQEQLWTMP